MNAIEAIALSKCYPTRDGETRAVIDASFSIRAGESVGIIGANGAGKSTLLKLLTGITLPTSGEAWVRQPMAGLLEAGTGFHPDLTGRENVLFSASLLGVPLREAKADMDSIIAFSGIAPFIDHPVRTYSTGMRMRLGFSVIAHLRMGIIALDEVLAVGDTLFQAQCIERVFRMRDEGRTVLFVSHSLPQVQQLCSRILVMDKGRIVFDGQAQEAVAHYRTLLSERSSSSGWEHLKSISIKSTDNEAVIHIELHGLLKRSSVDLGINVTDNEGRPLLHLSNKFIGKELTPTNRGLRCSLRFSHHLVPGNYPVSVYIGQEETQLEWADRAAMLQVADYSPYGFIAPSAIQAPLAIPFGMEVYG